MHCCKKHQKQYHYYYYYYWNEKTRDGTDKDCTSMMRGCWACNQPGNQLYHNLDMDCYATVILLVALSLISWTTGAFASDTVHWPCNPQVSAQVLPPCFSRANFPAALSHISAKCNHLCWLPRPWASSQQEVPNPCLLLIYSVGRQCEEEELILWSCGSCLCCASTYA